MTNIPELTDDEATVLRFQQARYMGPDFRALEKRGLSNWHDATVTDLGRAALAAYDAKERAKIISEEMAKIFQLPVPMTTATEVKLRQEYEERRLQHEKHCERLAAEQQRKIRVEAMRECLGMVERAQRWAANMGLRERESECARIANNIDNLIAKEQSQP